MILTALNMGFPSPTTRDFRPTKWAGSQNSKPEQSAAFWPWRTKEEEENPPPLGVPRPGVWRTGKEKRGKGREREREWMKWRRGCGDWRTTTRRRARSERRWSVWKQYVRAKSLSSQSSKSRLGFASPLFSSSTLTTSIPPSPTSNALLVLFHLFSSFQWLGLRSATGKKKKKGRQRFVLNWFNYWVALGYLWARLRFVS